MNLILLGPPGAGKGTLAERLSRELNIPHISTGELFRTAIKNRNAMGIKVQTLLDSGNLVPDDFTIAIVDERLKEEDAAKGFILDGFPRTIPQAKAFDDHQKIDFVINFSLDEESVIKRLSGRRICSKCGKGYHLEYIPPKIAETCDVCSEKLISRIDDQIDSIINRLEVYLRLTEPLIDYYESSNLLKTVDASPTAEEVLIQVKKTINRS